MNGIHEVTGSIPVWSTILRSREPKTRSVSFGSAGHASFTRAKNPKGELRLGDPCEGCRAAPRRVKAGSREGGQNLPPVVSHSSHELRSTTIASMIPRGFASAPRRSADCSGAFLWLQISALSMSSEV